MYEYMFIVYKRLYLSANACIQESIVVRVIDDEYTLVFINEYIYVSICVYMFL